MSDDQRTIALREQVATAMKNWGTPFSSAETDDLADVAIRVVLAAVTQRVEALPCSHTDSADLERVCRSCKAGRKRVDAGEVLTALDAPNG